MNARSCLLLCALAVAACSGPPPAARPAVYLSGIDNQQRSGVVGEAIEKPLIVRVSDGSGSAVSGVTVTWAVEEGGGSISPETSVSGPDGTTTAIATLGPKVGSNHRFSASAEGLRKSPVIFRATANGGAPTTLVLVSGDAQQAVAGKTLPAPMVVRVQDAKGNAVSGVKVTWTAQTAGATVTPASVNSGPDGTARGTATLAGPNKGGAQTFQATFDTAAAPVTFNQTALAAGLVYVDPPATGKLRLVKDDAASDWNLLTLKVVTTTPMTGFSAGMNLPVGEGVTVAPDGFIPGTALPVGGSPVAAVASVPTAGRLKGTLIVGVSQKAAGAGAVPTDSAIPAGSTLYTVKLALAPNTPARKVVDPAALPGGFWAGLRDRAGNDVAAPNDVAVGSLEIR